MKKDRNTFFQSAGMSSQTIMPQMPQMNQTAQPYFYNQMPAPIQASQASQSFYSGPDPQMINQVPTNYYDDLANDIAKLERQINRLDSRISKLENQLNINMNENNYSSQMYMV